MLKLLKESFSRMALDAALWGLSYLVPKESGRIAMGADLATAYKGNPRYLFEYLLDHPELGFEPVWITESPTVLAELRKSDRPTLWKFDIRAFWQLLRAEFLVIDFTPLDLFYFGQTNCGNFRFIQTAHGMPIKKGGQEAIEERRGRDLRRIWAPIQPFVHWLQRHLMFNVLLANYELIPAQSAESQRDLERLYVNENVEVLGAPRNDVFFSEKPRDALTDELELNDYSRIFLYCPTWRDQLEKVVPFSPGFLERLDKWLRERDSILLVKKHPLDKILFIGEGFSNIRDLTGKIDDIQDLCVHADVLISDYSSIVFDFCLTERPIIFYSYDYERYLQSCRGMIYDFYETMPGPFANDEKELFELLDSIEAWFGNSDFQSRYQAFIHRFNTYRDGRSSQRVAQYIKENLQPTRRWKPDYLDRLIRYRKRLSQR